jgi:hypothetical protein
VIRSNYLPTVLACLFCAACFLFTVINRLIPSYVLIEFESGTGGSQVTGWSIVAAGWLVACFFLVCGGFVTLLILFLRTITPLEADLASEVRQRTDANQRWQTADRRAAAAELASGLELDRLARLDAELQRKLACVDRQGCELHEKLLLLNQRIRATAPKQKTRRGDARKNLPKF